MAARPKSLAAAAVAATVLMTGAPAVAAPAGTLQKVALDTGGRAWARVLQVNGRGEILGYASDPEASGGIRPVLWQRYDTLTDLGRPGDYPMALNNRGDVLGETWIWRDGRIVSLHHPSQPVRAADLNDHGQVTGTLEGSTPWLNRAFRWQDGQFTDLGAPGDESWTVGIAVNNRGVVLGWVYEEIGLPAGGFLWRNGVMTVFGTEFASITPLDLNDRGQVLSNAQVTEDAAVHPYLWYRGRMTDLMAGRPHATGLGQDINGAGDVAGSIDSRPVLWRGGRTMFLLPPKWRGTAVSVNERGDVAGVAATGSGDEADARVFLWRDGRVHFSRPETGSLSRPYVAGVDERGRVAGGLGDPGTGETRAYVWRLV